MFQTNLLEGAPDMKRDSEKEWYYGNAEKERLGPYSFEEVGFADFCSIMGIIYIILYLSCIFLMLH
jgi:hypothetical protein